MNDMVSGLLLIQEKVADKGKWITTVREVVADVEAAEAAWKPAPEERSVWEIVRHMTVWTEWVVAFVQGKDTETEEWPAIADTSAAAWEAEKQRLFAAQDALIAGIAAIAPETLFVAPVPEVTTTSRFTGVASILVHNAYHAGQITKLHERYYNNETITPL